MLDPKGGKWGMGTEREGLIIWSEASGWVGNHTYSKPEQSVKGFWAVFDWEKYNVGISETL